MICIYGSKFERSLFRNQWFDVVGVVSVKRIVVSKIRLVKIQAQRRDVICLGDRTIVLELSWCSN